MPRLSSYSSEDLREKAQKARDFAQRCDREADRKEAQKLSNALLSTAKKLGVEPSKLMERLRTAQH